MILYTQEIPVHELKCYLSFLELKFCCLVFFPHGSCEQLNKYQHLQTWYDCLLLVQELICCYATFLPKIKDFSVAFDNIWYNWVDIQFAS